MRDTAEVPNLGTYSDRWQQGFLLLIKILHTIYMYIYTSYNIIQHSIDVLEFRIQDLGGL